MNLKQEFTYPNKALMSILFTKLEFISHFGIIVRVAYFNWSEIKVQEQKEKKNSNVLLNV